MLLGALLLRDVQVVWTGRRPLELAIVLKALTIFVTSWLRTGTLVPPAVLLVAGAAAGYALLNLVGYWWLLERDREGAYRVIVTAGSSAFWLGQTMLLWGLFG